MDTKPFTRNQIASRSRKRQQIKKEEAEKLGVIQRGIWLNKDQVKAIKGSDMSLDDAINKGLGLLLGENYCLPMDEVEENAFIRAKQVGL